MHEKHFRLGRRRHGAAGVEEWTLESSLEPAKKNCENYHAKLFSVKLVSRSVSRRIRTLELHCLWGPSTYYVMNSSRNDSGKQGNCSRLFNRGLEGTKSY